jgi:bilin biosynthesis protein
MSNGINSDNQLSQTETDALLKAVSEQLVNDTFDTSDRHLLQQMVESMGDNRGMVRFGFAERLGAVGKPAIPFLLDALANHNNPVVRRASAKTLTLIADPVAIPTLVHSFLNDEDIVVRGSAVGALARTGKESVPALLEILASPARSESIKGHAAWALSFIGTEAKEHLYEAIDSDSPEVRAAVIGAIAKVAQEKAEERAYNILINALNDPAENVRCEAAALLGNLTYRAAIPTLTQLLQHREGETRKAAALALMKIGDRRAIESLESALERESEENVQKAIALAISLLQRKSEPEDDDWD